MALSDRPTRTGMPRQARSPVATPEEGLRRRDIGPAPRRRPTGARPGPSLDQDARLPADSLLGQDFRRDAVRDVGWDSARGGVRRPAPVPGSERFTGYRARIRLIRAVWLVAFLALVFVPIVLAPRAGGEVRPWSRGGIWVELCMTSGLLGLSTLAATIVLPSRVKSLTKAFGTEEVLRSHRWLAIATTVIVLAHVVFILIDKPLNVLLLSPGDSGANRARAGLTATVALVLLTVLTLARQRLKTRYHVWRWVHVILAVAALVGTYLHIVWLNHLMQDAAERTVMSVVLVAVSAILINRWILRPIASLRHGYVVREVIPETDTVTRLVLTPASRWQRKLAHRPGQFAWIRLDSPFGPLQGNPFTISSAADDPSELEFTIRDRGDFTGSVRALEPGRRVYVDGPYGAFNSDYKGGESLLLLGAGVGMGPMMGLLRSHAQRGDQRPHCVISTASNPDELMFRQELRELAQVMDLRIIETVSKAPESWTGPRGRISLELLDTVIEQPEFAKPQVFICGPPQMVTDSAQMLADLGVPESSVHTEQFDMV